MANTCSICTHSEASKINKALVKGESYRKIANQFGCSQASVGRHVRNGHIANLVAEARQEQKNAVVEAVGAKVVEGNDLNAKVLDTLTYVQAELERFSREHREVQVSDTLRKLAETDATVMQALLSEAREEHKVAIQAHREIRGTIELVARLIGSLNDKHLHIHTNPEWMRLQTVILKALLPYPDAKKAVVEAVQKEMGAIK